MKANDKKAILVLFFIILFLVFVFWFVFWADKNKNESAALSTILELSAIQKQFPECYSLKELIDKKFIDSRLNDGRKAGYIFIITKNEKKCEITAKPENNSKGNNLFYSTNEDNWRIHFSTSLDEELNINSPTINSQKTY